MCVFFREKALKIIPQSPPDVESDTLDALTVQYLLCLPINIYKQYIYRIIPLYSVRRFYIL